MRTLEELKQLDWGDMTGEELGWLRTTHVPLHCQVMCRRSYVVWGGLVYSDFEALTPEKLAEKVAASRMRGWRPNGPAFIRTYEPRSV